jgi:hypothetical protein
MSSKEPLWLIPQICEPQKTGLDDISELFGALDMIFDVLKSFNKGSPLGYPVWIERVGLAVGIAVGLRLDGGFLGDLVEEHVVQRELGGIGFLH